ncbi:MAG: hypothetical protein J0L88_05640 [Xanthomonadales bacterium]|nr:hypothetical protein [Xanthomonadales bacterium]
MLFLDGFEPGFHVEMPELTIAPGEMRLACYYLRAPTTTAAGIRRWKASLQGLRSLIVGASYDGNGNPVELQPPGTLLAASCFSSLTAYWLFSAYPPSTQLVMPADDGAGQPLAIDLAPGQPIMVQLSTVNLTGKPVVTSALLEAELLPAGAAFTRTASFVSLNTAIFIPDGMTSTVSSTCLAPAGSRFWWLSTRTRRHAQMAEIRDGATTLLQSSDWAHPSEAQFGPPAFLVFSPSMTTRCTYLNASGHPLVYGDDEENDETCIGIGNFFPATRPRWCVNGSVP